MKIYGSAKVRRSGVERFNSLIITLPTELTRDMHLEYGDYLTVKTDSGKIILERVK